MLIYLVRHGESEANRQGVIAAKTSPLSARGIRQAQILAGRLVSEYIDLIMFSDALRAKQTARIINKRLRKKLILEPLLREKSSPKRLIGQAIKSMAV